MTCSVCIAALLLGAARPVFGTEITDPYLNLLLKKGVISEQEAEDAHAQIEAAQTNQPAMAATSKWKISNGIKDVGLFGDMRFRYEQREGDAPGGGRIELDRGRFALRLGLRGTAADDFYYGLRLETSANPRSPWVTFGTSSSGTPYQGPFGKSTDGIAIGQIYLGWKPAEWLEVTVGKMPNPLYTTSMVWDGDLNPEGAAERLRYKVGKADFFATFGQFLYQDTNPNKASGGLGINGLAGQTTDNIFQFAMQGGFTYHFTTNVFAKVGATVYQYAGLHHAVSPFFGDSYVGEGAFLGTNTVNSVQGASGFGTSWNNNPGLPNSLGFPNNQVGLNNLTVIEVPFELNLKLQKVDMRLFGDFAYNLDGKKRAEAAASAYSYFLDNFASTGSTLTGFKAQTGDRKAYQLGLAVGSTDGIGLVTGATGKKHGWEGRVFWQHTEQYALDPNIIDSDFFEGRENMEGIYGAVAYGFTDNTIATIRYGQAWRINKLLGTGGSNQDLPQINPLDKFTLLQFDFTLLF
ncbi:MAG TPA: putative porin [Verrucomicrobiae bacterium]|nr:putative porin [Verrucomicrobiae bacterium]